MMSRPKPGESEADLLRFQNQFLAAKASPAVKIVRKADKRRGELRTGENERSPLQHGRDVVMLDDFPEVPPSLTPAPPKKSKDTHVHFDEDPEEQLNFGDQHITVVLNKIIERDTSAASVTMPVFTRDPFPKVFHRSEIKTEARSTSGRKSIFAQKLAAKREAEGTQPPSPFGEPEQTNPTQASWGATVSHDSLEAQDYGDKEDDSFSSVCGHRPNVVTGEGLGILTGEQEAQKIHKENLERLQSMTTEQILEEQRQLLTQLDPGVLAFLKSRHDANTSQDGKMKTEHKSPRKRVDPEIRPESQFEAEEVGKSPFSQMPDIEGTLKSETRAGMKATDTDLPVKPQKGWLHMDTVELEKLEWMKDLSAPRQRKTKKGMQARFSLKGDLIPPDKDLPTHLGLHHHGEEAERAGYSLQELFHLSRSQVIQQRTLALQVLGHVVRKAKLGEFASLLKGSVLRTLLDAGFLFLLRFSLDDPVDNVVAASIHALHALLVSSDDEDYLDRTFSWYQGMMVYPFLPSSEEEGEEDLEEEDDNDEQSLAEKAFERKSKDEHKPDPEVVRYDVVKGLLKTRILHRMRYILEVMRPVPLVVLEILDILTRIARHSSEACSQVLDCPRLVETVIAEFLPTQWNPIVAETEHYLASLHGVPCASAMKLFRVLASGGRNACARLLNKCELKNRLSRFVAEDPEDISLRKEEAIKISTEAFRLWVVAAAYGQACDIFKDLFPVLMKMVASLSHLTSSSWESNSVADLLIQRAAAMVTLLTQVTQTAGCRAELQAQLSRSGPEGEDQIPPPPVTWDQVSGFRPIIETNLKECLKEISHLNTWQALQPLTTAYVLYMGIYYNKCHQQPSVNHVDCLEEVERLTSVMLMPLLNQPAMQSLWDMLRSCSVVCNPLSCSAPPESLPSIVSLHCTGGKLPMSLAGSKSPFPFLTAFLALVDCITSIHKGLVDKYATLLDGRGLNDYLLQSWTTGPPSLALSTAWLLRHEYHFQYLVLLLAQKVASSCIGYSQHASLHHSVAMVLLGRLLPGCEHMAHQILLGLIFNAKLIPEGKAGGPEAIDFAELLHLSSEAKPTHPGSAAAMAPLPSRGALLEEAYKHLPLIQDCYLVHFAYLEPALVRSRNIYQGQPHLIQSLLLPEVRGPILPSDWPFLPLINLYNKVTGAETRWGTVNSLPADLVNTVTRSLQWVLLLETWRARVLQNISAAAKLARLMCVFLTGNDLFLEGPVHCYTAALLSLYCHTKVLDSLNLDVPLPGLASFHDLYINLLEQFEGVSFGDALFGVFVLLPLQRRFSVQLRMAIFGEHVNTLRALGVSLQQFPVPLEQYLIPPEDNLNLLKQYFQTLVTGALRQNWCPVLYVVAVAHVNSFMFSQHTATQEIDAARKNLLQKTWLLVDETLKKHLLYYKLPNKDSPLGFDLYEQLPAIRQRYLHAVAQRTPQEET